MRDRSPGGIRARSPPPKIRVHQPTEWRPDTYPPPRANTREERPPRTLQSLSPPELDKSRRFLTGDSSAERRDYARHLDDAGDDRVRSRQSWNRTHFDEGFPRGDSPSIEYRRKYLMPEATDLNVDAIPSLKHIGSCGPSTSRISKEKDYQGSGSSAFDEHGMLVQKSMYMDDGTVQTFFSLPPDVGPSINTGKVGGNFLSSSSRNLNVGPREDEDLRYRDHLHLNKIQTRESYKEEERTMFYSKDISYPMMPLSQSKAFGSTSSGLSKEEFLGSSRDGLPVPSDGFGRSDGKFIDPFGPDGYWEAPHFDTARGPELRPTISPSRSKHRDYSYPELGRRERGDPGYPSDELYRKMQPITRGDYANRDSLRPSFMDTVVDRVDDIERSRRNPRESGLWDHHSLQGELVPNYLDVKRTSLATERDGEFLGSGRNHLEFETRVSRDHEISHPGGDYGFGRDAGPRSYKERLKSPPMSECDPDMYRLGVSSQQRSKAEELSIYGPSERVLKRKYIMDEEMSRHNPRSTLSSSRNISRRVQELSGIEEQWTGEDLGGLLLSERLNFDRLQYRKAKRPYDGMAPRRVSATDDWLSYQDLPVHVQGRAIKSHIPGGGDVSIKKRLRPAPLNFHNPYPLDRRQDFHKPYKFWKRSLDNRYGGMNVHYDDPSEDLVAPVKSDPPEDSEEFKLLIHRAFLRFSKQLNENPAHRRRYREQGKAGSLLCSVCGSLSKEFVDTRSLVTHAFMSLKVGLRADHLGLHKALCVLMGWNCVVPSDSAWVHQVLPDAEALALKEDLILWPPLVIIHNSSIGNKNPDERKVVTIEGLEAILRDMGFGGGKTKVCRGKPANQSIMVVKFMPTFSGLQEAERLHKYYTENKRGREDLKQICGETGVQADKVEHVLYGYMGIAEDLDKLDFETKKRCMVKSKKDIQEIADAPLKTD